MMRGALRWLYSRVWHRSWFMAPILAVRFHRVFGYWPNPIAPAGFNEKLFVRMAFDRRPLLTMLTGKVEAAAFVVARLGHAHGQARQIGVASRLEEIAGLALPERYICKASHGSGMVRFVTPQAPIAPAALADMVGRWLAVEYGRYGLEWSYHGVQPAVVFEEVLDRDGRVPDDIKFFCFDGRVVYVQCDSDRFEGHCQTLFDRDWNRLDVRVKDYAPHGEPPVRPVLFEAMLETAERLAAGIDFVRVDLFDLGDRFCVGELTTVPQGGYGSFSPALWDTEFGRHWRIPSFVALRGWS